MKKLLLLLLALAMLVPTTAFASDDLTPEQYKTFWSKLDAVITDNPTKSQEAYAKLLKWKAGKPEAQNLPDGTKINYYPVGDNLGGVFAKGDSKVSAYELKNLEKNGIIGLAGFFKFDMPADFQGALDHPEKESNKHFIYKVDKLGFGLYVHPDTKNEKAYLYDVIIFRDLDLFDTIQKAFESEKN